MVATITSGRGRRHMQGGRKLAQCVSGIALALSCALGAAPIAAQITEQVPAAPRFAIQRFIVEGNSLLPRDEVERIVQPFAGPDRDFGDVQRALEALQDTYLERGYSAVRVLVPEQDLVAGQVRLQVIEARIRNVRVEGNKYFSEANVRAGLPTVVPGEPPNTRRIGENVQLSNENPAKNVGVRLQATEEAGKVDAVVRVTDDPPLRYTVFLDNTGNSETGEWRAGAGVMHANVADRDQILTAQAITSPTQPSDVLILGVGYRIPVYRWGGAFDFIAGYSDVDSGVVQNLFTVSGKGTIAAARYTQVLPRIGAYEQKLALGFDYRDYRQNVGLVGVSGTLVPDIRTHALSLGYLGRLSRVGQELAFQASYAKNIPGGADGDQAAFEAQRPGANARFEILRAGGSYTHALPMEALLRVAANFQYTWNALIPGEQFGMGGIESVRGFELREAANDTGYRVSAEVYTPDFGSNFGDQWRARALAFVDTARGRDNVPQRATENGLASVGFGVRLTHGKALSLLADFAYVTNGIATRVDGSTRAHVAAVYSFW
jgi:hemolysin activation/secretion protein